MPEFKIFKDGFHQQFLDFRSKVQIIGGGFGNGKTTSGCVKILSIAQNYPGANILVGRSTYPKLNDTVRKEFFKWLPKSWIKRWSESSNTLELQNGSTINFRYVKMQKREKASSGTSNLLSATYDAIFIDQMDDPEFDYEDFTSLMGRLRGSAKYSGQDHTMPDTGPRWMLISLNPTRNWIFRKVIKPVLDYKEKQFISPALNEMLQGFRTENVDDLIRVISGSSYENAHNLAADYLHGLEALYTGVMKQRFLFGGWEAFEGLIYPSFDLYTHMVPEYQISDWMDTYKPQRVLEMYDHGLTNVSCYMLGLGDGQGNIALVDGFHKKNQSIEVSISSIQNIRREWRLPPNLSSPIHADPAVFRKTQGEYRTVGKSVADIFHANGKGLRMVRGNNDITSGIAKVNSYLLPHQDHKNPFTGEKPGPFIYFNEDRLGFLVDEITDYFYADADDPNAESDKPMDGKDHAMDALKYGLTSTPSIIELLPVKKIDFSRLTKWHEEADGQRQANGTAARGGRYSTGINYH